MIISIEVGTQEEQNAIRKELETLFGILLDSGSDVIISKVIVAKEFDSTVNNLLAIKSYKSLELIGDNVKQVEAKVINSNDGIVVVISPTIFNDKYDQIVRSNLYFHEIVHCFNALKLPPEPSGRSANKIYLRILRLLIDEYMADVKSYKAIDTCWKDKSDLWMNSISTKYIGYCALINDKSLPEQLERIKTEFLSNKDITNYLSKISPIINDVLITTIHAIALSDYYPDICNISKILCSSFVNQDIVKLVEYIRKKYRSNDFGFEDGQQIIINAVNIFGLTLRDEGSNLQCRVW